MDLISGLPEDIARDCLTRVKYDQFSAVASVCKSWKVEIELPEFSRIRKLSGHAQRLIVMVQARFDPTRYCGAIKSSAAPVYRLTLFEPETGNWTDAPPIPGLPNGLPMFCKVAGVGSNLVVLGGWDPLTWKASRSVYIYSFLSSTWRRGSEMPGCPRSFFGCASDSNRTVYVAGGHDDEKNALRSAMAYDVAKDEWISLPDMERERDECKAVFQCGNVHVIGGYCTEMQGRFERTAEAFDVATWRWNLVTEDFLEPATCPRTCVNGDDEAMYVCNGGKVVRRKNATWQTVAKLPDEVRNVAFVMTWDRRMFVIGSSGYGAPHMAYNLSLDNYNWLKVETPLKFSTHVQSGCCMEI
ncbi:hypothetical protein UlMin_016351 [Ulmus minor]